MTTVFSVPVAEFEFLFYFEQLFWALSLLRPSADLVLLCQKAQLSWLAYVLSDNSLANL